MKAKYKFLLSDEDIRKIVKVWNSWGATKEEAEKAVKTLSK